MHPVEAPNDSIFRVPQRLKNAIGLLVATTIAVSCAPKPIQPPIGSTEMPENPTPTHIDTYTTITPTETTSPVSTSTETSTLTPTAAPEQLGGSRMAYMWNNEGAGRALLELPESVLSLLVPSSPDVWKQPTGYTYSDGTPVPWLTSFITERIGGSHVVYVFAKVRGVVREPYPPGVGEAGGFIFPVLEIPTFQGGSNFIVGYEQEGPWATYRDTGLAILMNGVPLDWDSQNIFPAQTVALGTTFHGVLNGKEVGALLESYIGKTILISYSIDDGTLAGQSMKQVAEGVPIRNNGASVVDAYNPIVAIIEQK